MIRADGGCRALFLVPLVATATWYLTTLLRIWIADGQLEWGPDVVAFGVGALVIGLPLSVVVTLFVAAPIYRVVEDRGRLGVASALSGGALIGAAVSLVFWFLEGRYWTTLPLWQGVAVGVVSAACWWWLRGLSWRRDSR